MKINFFSHKTFENWHWETPFTTGIGGSEVSHIEMSERLAIEHDVTSYAPIPEDKKGLKETVAKWKSYKECKFEEEGIWIIYRTIAVLDIFNKRPDQKIWIVMQDTHIVEDWTKERTDKIDRIITLCKDHAKFVAECHPEVKDKIVISSNGVRTDLIEELSKKEIVRDPKSLIWASSPDRGMDTMITIFKRAYEWDNELKLNIYYGFNNLDKGRQTSRVLALKKTLEENKDHPGIKWHGRVDQMTLYESWFKSGIWCYPTTFTETSPVHGDTLVETLEGQKKIKDLVGKKDFYIYSCNEKGKLSISKVKWCGLTRKKAPVIKLTCVPGKGRNAKKAKELILTPDHEVMMKSGHYRPAGNLKVGDRVKAFHYQPKGFGSNYPTAGLTDEKKMHPLHRFVAEFFAGRKLKKGEIVHHLDGNTFNNTPSNLEITTQDNHAREHNHAESEDTRKKKIQTLDDFHNNCSPQELKRYKQEAVKARWKHHYSLSSKEQKKRLAYFQDPALRAKKSSTMKAFTKEKWGDKPWWNKDLLQKEYVDNKENTVSLGKKWGCSSTAIGSALRKFNIPIRSNSESHLVLSNHVITKIEEAGNEDVYCMEVEPDHNFIANGIVVHNCITCMDAQACGAIPITNPLWALKDNVRHGIFIQGDVDDDKLIQSRYVEAIVSLANNPQLQESIREKMMPYIRSVYDWDRWCDEWTEMAEEDLCLVKR